MEPTINIIASAQNNMGWTQGTVTIGGSIYRFDTKHFDEPSHYGIQHGRISKLCVSLDNECKINYDRGWDVRDETTATNQVLDTILKRFN